MGGEDELNVLNELERTEAKVDASFERVVGLLKALNEKTELRIENATLRLTRRLDGLEKRLDGLEIEMKGHFASLETDIEERFNRVDADRQNGFAELRPPGPPMQEAAE